MPCDPLRIDSSVYMSSQIHSHNVAIELTLVIDSLVHEFQTIVWYRREGHTAVSKIKM